MFIGRILSFALLVNILLAQNSFAKDVTVFDVRRPLAMENDQTPPKDYYINAGTNDGLRVGVILTVYRRQTLYDVYQNKSPGDLIVAVGELRIIHVQGEISVARLEKLHTHDDYPNVDFDAIMVGDKADLGSARMAPRKTASLTEGLPIDIKAGSPSAPSTSPGLTGSKDFSSVSPTPVSTSAPL